MPDLLHLEFVWPYLLSAVVAGYLLGSIPFGLVICLLLGKGDIRKVGSGNIGVTNVLRAAGKAPALATLILDSGKGVAALLIADALYGPDIAVMAAAGTFLGHLFPVWLKFRGGKGVATALGILLAGSWPIGALACLTWLVVAILFRLSSLSALVAMALSPLYAKVFGWMIWPPFGSAIVYHQLAELALFIAALVWLRHVSNMGRLLRGEEPKIGEK